MVSKVVLTVFFMFCFCLRNYGCSSTVTTVQLDGVDVIDCVEIHSQPSLDHPLLKNHKIQITPSKFPYGGLKNSFIKSTKLESKFKKETICPYGSVPIHRTTTLEDEVLETFHIDYEYANPFPVKDIIRMNKIVNVTYYGVLGRGSVYNLTVGNDQSSFHTIWLQNAPPDRLNVLAAGWTVSTPLNGNNDPRLFIYWTKDGHKTGCFNNIGCMTFIQVHPSIGPKSRLASVSTYGGTSYDYHFMIYQDPITGNWWFVVEKKIVVGYWPKEVVAELGNGAETVAWGGLGTVSKGGVGPPIGSGHSPDGYYDHAAYFRNVQYIVNNKGSEPRSPPNNAKITEDISSKCYGIDNDKNTPSALWGYRFAFGGPGGC